MYKGNKRELVFKEVWWVVCIIREAKVVGVRVWIMTAMGLSQSLLSTKTSRKRSLFASMPTSTLVPSLTALMPPLLALDVTTCDDVRFFFSFTFYLSCVLLQSVTWLTTSLFSHDSLGVIHYFLT